MGHFIHTKSTPDGLRYRIWSSGIEGYVTPEMTEREVTQALVESAMDDALMITGIHIAQRLQRAADRGTSSQMGGATRQKDAWDVEGTEWQPDKPNADPAEFLEGNVTTFLTNESYKNNPKPLVIGDRVVKITYTVELITPPEHQKHNPEGRDE